MGASGEKKMNGLIANTEHGGLIEAPDLKQTIEAELEKIALFQIELAKRMKHE